jgi:hypothetical protein
LSVGESHGGPSCDWPAPRAQAPWWECSIWTSSPSRGWRGSTTLSSPPESGLGVDLSRPVPVRRQLHRDLRPQRLPHVPVAGLRLQRGGGAPRAELRRRPLRRPAGQQLHRPLEPSRLPEGVHPASPDLRPLPAPPPDGPRRVEAVGGRRLPLAVGRPCPPHPVPVRRPCSQPWPRGTEGATRSLRASVSSLPVAWE